MEFGLQVRSGWEGTVAAAGWAEETGLAAFAMPDHYLQRGDEPEKPAYDHLVHLAALARETKSIELVGLVSPVTFRHPAVLYKMSVTIDEVSDGRFTLGVGTGWLEEEFELFGLPYPDQHTRYEMLEECLGYLKAALAPGPHPFDGKHYQLSGFDPHPHPADLRLLVGGSGKVKTPRLAGAYADEYNIYVTKPDDFSAKAATAREAAEKAGRDFAGLLLSSAGPALAAKNEGDYRRLLERLAEMTGQTPQHIEEVYTRRGYPHGFGAKPAEMMAALEEAGCRRFYLQMFAVAPADYGTILDAYRG
jgi:alkanesulfonate monooxygenase SsuD/methylene tetrahydromethanopterin reductase-like flavin-dependent oxidoreductase (luciferase family)